MKPTQDNILIKLIDKERRKKDELVITEIYTLAEIVEIGGNVEEVKNGDTILIEQADIQRLIFNKIEYLYIHKSKIYFYEDRKTKEKETTKK